MVNAIGFWTLTKREVLRFLRQPTNTVMPALVSTILFIAIFGWVLGERVQEISGFPYIVFMFPGLLMMGASLASFNNATFSLFLAKWDHYIHDLLVAPISYLEMVLALVLGSLARGMITGALVILAGVFLTATPFSHPLLLIWFLFITTLLFSTFGMIVGLWADRWDQLSTLQNYILTPLIFLGGVFYSSENIPEAFRWLHELNPVFYMVSGIRYACLGTADVSPLISTLVTVAVATIGLGFVTALFRKGYKLRT